MTESYCGLSCKDCTRLADGTCLGCKMGPGRAISGDCEIARCCREKGHFGCNVCVNRGNCSKWTTREGMAAHRQRKSDAEKWKQSILARELPELARWLRILLIARICGIIFSAFQSDSLAETMPMLHFFLAMVSLVVQLVAGGVLLKLGGISSRYRIAGLCYIVVELVDFIPILVEGAVWMLFLGFAMMIPLLVGEYQEILAHAEQLEEINEDLAQKWRRLWIWYFVATIVMLISGILSIIASTFGAFIMLVSTVVLMVIGILRIFYLYRTVQEFRNYPVES